MTNELDQWLDALDLGRFRQAFAMNEITFSDLVELTESDLREMGLPIGPRRRALRAIREMGNTGDRARNPAQEARTLEEASAERRQLTVMFCDLVGSTELSGRLDPEDMREVLKRYQDVVSSVIIRHGGHVANYLGDGVLAYFGWPRAHEDQAARAVRAGLATVEAVATAEMPVAECLEARIGIATGKVVIGDLAGKTAHQSGAVAGDTPNLAARLQNVAKPGEVVIDEQTSEIVAGQFLIAPLGPQSLKGILGPINTWRCLGEAVVDSRFAARNTTLLGFVGREHELGLLLDRWRLVQRGQGQVVVLYGEAGIGKSRLSEELRRKVEPECASVLTLQCAPQYVNSAFLPVIRHFQHVAGFAPGDDEATRLDKLDTLVEGNTTVGNLLSSLLSLPGESRYGALDMAPEARPQHMKRALITKILSGSRHGPMLIQFEDAHWSDPSTEDLLHEIVLAVPEAPVLVVVTARPEWAAPWIGQPHANTLNLSRLDAQDAAIIVAAISGTEASSDAISGIVARTDGVPLFIEELTRAVLERGEDAATGEIPMTLEASLSARLDRLEPSAREIAQVGAVIGREFGHDLVSAIAGVAPSEVDAAVEGLLKSQLVLRARGDGERRYVFKHALVQDAAYASLLRQRRRELHGAIAARPDLLARTDKDGLSELLAHHFSRAGDLRQAVVHWQAAAQRSTERSTYLEAKRFLDKALAALREMDDDADVARSALELRLTLRPVLGALGDYRSILANVVAAEALAERLGDERTRVQLCADKTHVLYHLGRLDEAIENGEQARSMAQNLGMDELLLPAVFNLGQSHFFAGDGSKALETVEPCLTLLEGQFRHAHLGGTGTSSCTWFGNAAGACALLGGFDRAYEFSNLSCAIAEEVDDPFDIGQSQGWRAFVLVRHGHAELVTEILAPLISVAEQRGIAFQGLWFNIMLSYAHSQLHRHDSAIACGRRAVEEADRLGLRALGAMARAALAEAAGLAGDAVGSADPIDDALEAARLGGHRIFEIQALRAAGHALASSAHPDLPRARRHYEASLARAEEVDARPDCAHAHAALAELHLSTNETEVAQHHRGVADRLYREMSMDVFLIG